MADDDLESSFISFTATAAFALPEPYGIFASGGITFFQSVFGGSSDDAIAKAFKAAVTAILDGVKELLELEDITKDKDAINDNMDWLQETTKKITEMTDAGLDPTATIKDALPKLEAFITPGSAIRAAMQDLSNHLENPIAKRGDDEDSTSYFAKCVTTVKTKLTALDLYGSLLAVYATELRLRLQFYSQVGRDDPDYNSRVYDHYLDFRDQTNSNLASLSEIVLLISDELRALAHADLILHEGPSPAVPFLWVNYFTGESISLRDLVPILAVRRAAELSAAWSATIDTKMEPSRKLTRGFEEKLQDWSQQLRPTRGQPPAGDPSQTMGTLRARYALTFANGGGEGPISPTSDEVKLLSEDSDVLTVPIDPMGLAQSRKVYRQLDGAPFELLGIVPDNVTQAWMPNPGFTVGGTWPRVPNGADGITSLAMLIEQVDAALPTWSQAASSGLKTAIAQVAPGLAEPGFDSQSVETAIGAAAFVAFRRGPDDRWQLGDGPTWNFSELPIILGICVEKIQKAPKTQSPRKTLDSGGLRALLPRMPWIDPNN